MEIWGKEFPFLGSVLGNNILRRNEGSRTGQWGKLNCHTALTKGSASPAGNSEAGMALQRYPPNRQGGQAFVLLQLTVRGCGLPWGRDLTLGKGTSFG